MGPKDQKPEISPGNDWEQDLELLRSALSGPQAVEPPDLLNQAVLNTARRELSAPRRKPMRWIGAFATAAVVVLALTIVVKQDKQSPQYHHEGRLKQDSDRPAEPEKEALSGVPLKLESPPVTAQPGAVLRKRASPAPQAHILEYKTQQNTAGIAAGSDTVLESRSPDSKLLDEELDAAEEYPLTADVWIARMLKLLQAERYQELKLEKVAFRKAHPNYPLPAELQD